MPPDVPLDAGGVPADLFRGKSAKMVRSLSQMTSSGPRLGLLRPNWSERGGSAAIRDRERLSPPASEYFCQPTE